jgi:hypothetical protein
MRRGPSRERLPILMVEDCKVEDRKVALRMMLAPRSAEQLFLTGDGASATLYAVSANRLCSVPQQESR